MQRKQVLNFLYLVNDIDNKVTAILRDTLLYRITQNFNQPHANDVVKGNGATFKQRSWCSGRDAEGAQSCGFKLGDRAGQIIRLIAKVVDNARGVAQGKLVYWSRSITGPDNLHCRMSGMGAKLQVDVLYRVENGFAELIAERVDKLARLIRSTNG
jgi:hypothetical protein